MGKETEAVGEKSLGFSYISNSFCLAHGHLHSLTFKCITLTQIITSITHRQFIFYISTRIS